MSEAHIYNIPVSVGLMQVSMNAIVIAPDVRQAKDLLLARFKKDLVLDDMREVEELGTAKDPAPRVYF